jgi:phosphoribosyl 1,2-cyclic phosphodiesterase
MPKMRITILGCGGSDGVPMLGGPDGRGDWGECDPANAKNRRTRASIHVAAGDIGLLIDTSPDLRDQLLANGIGRVTHIAFTHDHADHTHGINELRRLARYGQARRIPRSMRMPRRWTCCASGLAMGLRSRWEAHIRRSWSRA